MKTMLFLMLFASTATAAPNSQQIQKLAHKHHVDPYLTKVIINHQKPKNAHRTIKQIKGCIKYSNEYIDAFLACFCPDDKRLQAKILKQLNY